MIPPVKVLVVDDSRTARAMIRHAFQGHPDLVITGEASNPLEAKDMIIKEQPDVITLDIEMPNINGLQFLDKIMRLRPIPVVMVSSLTERNAELALTALQMGAFDCFPKAMSSAPGVNAYSGLPGIVRQAAKSKPETRVKELSAVRMTPEPRGWAQEFSVIAIGSSTGGVEALEEVLSGFPASSPPIVICQHMPAFFTASFATRLDKKIGGLTIREAQDRETLGPGDVRIAPGGTRHMTVATKDRAVTTRLHSGPPVSGHVPSVDVLFDSVAEQVGKAALGIILTGMGQDGAEGLLSMRRAGAWTIAQDKATSVVYGMPRVAAEIGGAAQIVPLGQISHAAMTARIR
ncbi:chemotaxis response regulator protein-glutamate methylesterase [Asaia sp. W19]|uniref:protein-glutamate methylesterase/protein-glutamine glutaminase n=1 Tax=unclassified Asaia TaxID=2685023 RepID=UPI000F8E48C1|nr:chemotaxis response regulator protein-glutamate methylesterase [Asaia sp. W19]RUT26237.1 chemotaxis response regulator protein-glutamate methylesterase [Asaia sp. W19]